MNPISADPTLPPPQPPRSSFSCDRHPSEQFTGFCPSCLCERLTSLDNSSSNTPSSSRRPSSASATAAAIKSLFSSNFKSNNYFPPAPAAPKTLKPSSFAPQLRRTKSFSASKNETLGLSFEPQRKSCDVRVKNTLWSLFTLHDDTKSSASATINIPISSSVSQETEIVKNSDNGHDEIAPVEEEPEPHLNIPITAVEIEAENVDNEVVSTESLKPMNDHINLQNAKVKKGFRAAASVFTKKWQKWREKQKRKTKKMDTFVTLPEEKPISRQYRETQSEIADYGFGRRSCDTDPRFSLDAGRFSLDAGRISVDDQRCSFEEPRASWDGHFLGRSFSRMAPMVSLMEDLPETNHPRPDMVIPVEPAQPPECIPGGSAQTREYYSDSSSRRRKSADRSSLIKKTAAAVVAEIDEQRTMSNIADYSSKVIIGDKNFNSNSLRDEFSDTFELRNGFRSSSRSFSRNNFEKKDPKKSRRWSWRIWGFIRRRSSNENGEDEDKCSSRRVGRSHSESLERSWEAAKMNRNMMRSNSSVSWRNSTQIGGSGRRSIPFAEEISGFGYGKKKRQEMYSYSPNNIADNGLLRFYLAPQMMNSTSSRGGMVKTRQNGSHSIAGSVMRLY